MNATAKLNTITAALVSGGNVQVGNVLVTPKTFKKWQASGHVLFKVVGKSLYMARGKKFDCVDFSTIQVAMP